MGYLQFPEVSWSDEELTVTDLRIVYFPHPALRFPSKPVTQIDESFRTTVRKMFDLMYEAKGIGLAANQVGIPLRFFILNLTADPDQPDQEQVFINPEILRRQGHETNEEGCLSFPDLFGEVPRAQTIRAKAYDLNGRPFEVDADDLLSRAIQHEADHLAGKLFIDHFSEYQRATALSKIRDIEGRHRQQQTEGLVPPDEQISAQLKQKAIAGGVRV